MNVKIKSLILSSITILISVLIVVTVVKATTNKLVPSASVNPTMYTLEDIYQRIVAGTAFTVHTLAVPGTVSGTMHTLSDIYGVVPTPAQVLKGVNAGTANDPAGATGGRTAATSASDILSTKYAFKADGIIINGTAIAVTPALVWQTDPNVSLCWSAGSYEQSNGCSQSSGFVSSGIAGTTLIGAKEYCQYLKQDASGLNCSGSPITCTAVDYWRLPNAIELTGGLDNSFMTYNDGSGPIPITGATGMPGGFQSGTTYWSISPYDTTDAWVAISYGSINSYNDVLTSQDNIRCVH